MALQKLLNSFETDTDEDGKIFWMYYGDVDPKDAAAELARLRLVESAAIKALESLRSTTRNWDEQCLFDAHDVLAAALDAG